MLESSWLKLTFFRFFWFERSAEELQQCLLYTAAKKLHVISVGHKLQRRTLCDTRRDVHLGHLIALKVPTFQQPLRLTWFITLLRIMQHLECKLYTSITFVSKTFLDFKRCDNTKQASMVFRRNQLNLTWKTSLKLTTQTSRKNSKHVNISFFTLSLKKDDIVLSFFPCQPSTTLWLTRNWI